MSMNLISECEKEQLHLSGQIQPFGALLIVDAQRIICHASENIEQYLGYSVDSLLGQSLPEELDLLLQGHMPVPEQPVYQQLQGKNHFLDIVLSQHNDQTSLSFTVAQQDYTLPQVPSLPALINDQAELDHYRKTLLQWIAETTGHHRCMYYQFLDDGDGCVIAEVCNNQAEGTYLDLRFPASDIPQIARSLYVKNPWRQIPDAQAEAVAIRGQAERADLSYTDLRSVSPVHQIYMSNMGVQSSISFPIIRNGELDALISCHSSEPLLLTNAVLLQIAKVLELYNTALKDYDIRERLKVIDEFNYKTENLRTILHRKYALEAHWDHLAQELMHNFSADGIILCRPSDTLVRGNYPNIDVIDHIDTLFRSNPENLIWHTDRLQQEISDLPLTSIAGVAGVKFRVKGQINQVLTLYLLREEYIHEVQWGGNPDKPTEFHDGSYGIAPRMSFSKWVEKRIGHSKPWPGSIRLELLRLRNLLEQAEIFSPEIEHES